jgi:hypothetical protein
MISSTLGVCADAFRNRRTPTVRDTAVVADERMTDLVNINDS